MSTGNSKKRGLGVLALGGSAVLILVGFSGAVLMAGSQPLAPAVLGGGSILTAMVLGRWGVRTALR